MAQVVPNIINLSSDEEDESPTKVTSFLPSEPRLHSLQPFSTPPIYSPSSGSLGTPPNYSSDPRTFSTAPTLATSKRQRLLPLRSDDGSQLPEAGKSSNVNRRFLSNFSGSPGISLPNGLYVPGVTNPTPTENYAPINTGFGPPIPQTSQQTGFESQPQIVGSDLSHASTGTRSFSPRDQHATSVNGIPSDYANSTQLSAIRDFHIQNPPQLHRDASLSSRPISSAEHFPASSALVPNYDPPFLAPSRFASLSDQDSSNQGALYRSPDSRHYTLDSPPPDLILPTGNIGRGNSSSLQAALSARSSSSLSRIPENIEVISLDSDNEDEPRPNSVVNFVNNDADTLAGPINRNNPASIVAGNINNKNTVDDNDDDDDLMILDDYQAANVASRFNKQTYNGPAPVPHVSDPNFQPRALVANQLQARIDQTTYDRHNLVKKALKTRSVVSQLQNMLRAATKTVANLKRQLISVAPQETGLSDSLRGLIQAKEEEIRRTEGKISHSINDVIGCELLIRRIDQFLTNSQETLGRMDPQMPFQTRQPSVPKPEPELEPMVDRPLGYVPNVYSDDADLRNFIDSIRPDEENDQLEATPDEMSINLMKHQRMGLAWLQRMESSRNKGGILADDMGLGKTVQTLALVVANRAPPQECNTTVIIAPVSLLRQWAGEAESKIKPDSALRIGIYHGADKKILNTCTKMMQFDIILTSYGTLSSEWKRHFKEALKSRTEGDGPVTTFMPKPQDGGKSYMSPFFAPQAKFHRIVLDEAQNIKNKSALASKAVTYIKAEFRLCLSGTPMQNKVEELFPFIRFLQIRPYHLEHKFRADISLPLKSKSGDYDDVDKQHVLNKIRALLKAILLRRLKTTLIDGKPILLLPQKHLISDYVDMDEEEKNYYDSLELGIQMKAKKLMLEKHGPGASLNILTLLLRLRQACCHSFLVEIGLIKAKFNSKDEDGQPSRTRDWRRMLLNLRQLDQVAVDRIRLLGTNGASASDNQDPRESNGSGENNQALISSNNIPADSKTLISGINTLDDIFNSAIENEPNAFDDDDNVDDEMFTCPVCYDVFSSTSSIVIFPRCGHMICDLCTDSFFESNQMDEESSDCRLARCIECQNKVKDTELIDYTLFVKVHHENLPSQELATFCGQYYAKAKVPGNDEIIQDLIPSGEKFKTSAKIEKCVELIKDIFENHADEKVIIFSQFTTLFDVMKIELESNNIDYMRFDGTMSLDQKNETIKNFYQKDIKVLLLSLRAGNTGLTLTCASHVIIMDPFWNPFVEDQAMDRAHRIGQERQVYVHRILISGTVESRIMELQDSKKEMVNAALDETGMKNVSRLGQRELGFLFGLNTLR